MQNFKRYSVYFVLMLMLLTSKMIFAQLQNNGGFESSPVGVVTSIKGWYIGVADTVKTKPVFEIVSDTIEQGHHALKVSVFSIGVNKCDIQAV